MLPAYRTSTPPGEILAFDYLGLGSRYTAHVPDWVPEWAAGIITNDDTVTAYKAAMLAEWLGTTPDFWLNLQKNYDSSLK